MTSISLATDTQIKTAFQHHVLLTVIDEISCIILMKDDRFKWYKYNSSLDDIIINKSSPKSLTVLPLSWFDMIKRFLSDNSKFVSKDSIPIECFQF